MGTMGKDHMTTYYAIGPHPGTNLLKEEDGLVYLLNDQNEWQEAHAAIRHLEDPETQELTSQEAQDAYARITGGKTWVP